MKIFAKMYDEDTFHSVRSNRIGSSQIGTILNLNPFQSSLELAVQRRDGKENRELSPAMKMGIALEPAIAKLAEEKLGPLQKCDEIWGYDEDDRLVATPDYLGVAENGDTFIVEIKHSTLYRQWENESCPDQAYCQIQWQMGIGGIKKGYVVGLVGNRYEDLKIVPVEFAPQIFGAAVDSAQKWLDDLKTDKLPEPRASDVKTLLDEAHPKEEPIELDITDLVETYTKLSAEKKELSKEVNSVSQLLDATKVQILTAMGEHRVATCEDHQFEIVERSRKEYISKAATWKELKHRSTNGH